MTPRNSIKLQTSKILQKIERLLGKLADLNHVDEVWKVRAVIDRVFTHYCDTCMGSGFDPMAEESQCPTCSGRGIL